MRLPKARSNPPGSIRLRLQTASALSIHTVAQQFIKPVTKAAGDVSWALLKHPEGLPCDVFITHGWSEGIYEFVDQVENSWPRHATGAYVCFLFLPFISALVCAMVHLSKHIASHKWNKTASSMVLVFFFVLFHAYSCLPPWGVPPP